MKHFSKEIKVALAAIIAAVLLYYGINFLKGINIFKKNVTYVVNFSNITGLAKNNAVFVGGFPLGTVQDIAYDYQNPGNIYVTIEVGPEMRIPTNSRAELTSSMLGTTTMNLILSDSQQMLQPGDTIYGAPQVGALDHASNMIPKIEKLMPKFDSILTAFNQLASDPALAQTLHNTAEITDELKTTTHSLNKLLEKDLPQLMVKMNTISGNIENMTNNLATIDYKTTITNVDNTLKNTQILIKELDKKLNNPDGNIGLLLNDRKLYDNLNKTLISTDSLLINFREHPKRYVHFSLFGKKDK